MAHGQFAGSLASGFFAARDQNHRFGLTSPEDFCEFLDGERIADAIDPSGILSDWPSRLVFRGQSDEGFGLSSSLFRERLKIGPEVSELDLANAEEAIIRAMRAEGLGRRMTDGELLMVLQHHGIPTRLIDVSDTPKEAAFFSVDKDPEKDGRFFIIALQEGENVSLSAQAHLPWSESHYGATRSSGEWTNRVALVDELPLDPRMRAQNGRFLVGGLLRSYSGMILGGLSAKDWNLVSTLAIKFYETGPRKAPNRWGAAGWTVRVPAEWKPTIRRHLAEDIDPLTEDTMYPPITEVRRLAMRVVQEMP